MVYDHLDEAFTSENWIVSLAIPLALEAPHFTMLIVIFFFG
jgi:hypothetical protein